jgi:arginase family enzyme
VVIRQALATGKVRGINVTIFNPALDESGEIARAFTDTLVAALRRGVAT